MFPECAGSGDLMTGKIDKSGYLFIERGGCFERQYCPNTRKEPCGHSCPLFGEPAKTRPKIKSVYLSLCKDKLLVFTRFIDEREEFK